MTNTAITTDAARYSLFVFLRLVVGAKLPERAALVAARPRRRLETGNVKSSDIYHDPGYYINNAGQIRDENTKVWFRSACNTLPGSARTSLLPHQRATQGLEGCDPSPGCLTSHGRIVCHSLAETFLEHIR